MVDTVALLERAPAALRRLAYRVAAGRGPLGRAADAARFRFSDDQIPRLPQPGSAPVRLVFGPANSAGQGYQWARAAERNMRDVTATAVQGIGSNPFLPDDDLRIPVAVYQRSASWHAAFESYLSRQTHVVWESGLPLLGRRYGSDVLRELAHLQRSGVKGALMFHGSDIRPPSVHAALSPWSPFHRSSGPVHALSETASANAALAAAAGVPVFVSTPDLLQWVAGAFWCPVVVDPAPWRAATAGESSAVVVVAHAPSQKWMKGTDRIEPMLRRLSEEGVIDYQQVVGIPHSAMPDFYARADIVLDQFALGSYGVAACEAMATGRLVMGHIEEATRAEVHERTGLELPIHEATIETLEAELRRAAAEPQQFELVRAAGPAFVEEVHDGRRSAAALASFLGVRA